MKVSSILGTMAMGQQMNLQTSIEAIKEFSAIGNELDTAIMYNLGKSEEIVGQAIKTIKQQNFKVATKANPWFDEKKDKSTSEPIGGLKGHLVKRQFELSMKNLKMDKVSLFYLHAPDHQTPIEETLKAVQELYEEGKFDEWGLSNFHAKEVSEIYDICQSKGWKPPTVYQGMYNCITRAVEAELFPVLRKAKMRFYAYNPLAGGILTGKYKFDDNPKSGRFNGETIWGKKYQERYWKDSIFKAIEKISNEAEKSGSTLLEVSMSWMYNHSKLSGEEGDGVILGASTLEQVKNNVKICQNLKPLKPEVIKAMEEAWELVKDACPNYYR